MSKDNENKTLFEDFKAPSKQDWVNKAITDLKGADFDRRLVWKNLNDLAIQPFYTRNEDRKTLNNTGENCELVTNYRRIIVNNGLESNKLAHKAIKEGMTGLLFDIRSDVAPGDLLKEIDLSQIPVSFLLQKEQLSFADVFSTYLTKESIDKNTLKGYIDLDIFNNYLETGSYDNDLIDKLADLQNEFQDVPNFKSLVISGTIYQDAGANQVQEIAYTLNSMVFLIEELSKRGIDTKSIMNGLYFILGVSAEYFIEIAKFRVFNNLLNAIAGKYGIADLQSGLAAKTSLWSKSVTDANTNMLRSTTEAMSALLGNVQAIELDPYDQAFKEPNDFSKRIAGNITTILKEESYFGKVANPVDGSYYIEELSVGMAENALQLFKQIEAEGGFQKAVESELIQRQIAEIRMKKIKLLSQRRQAMVGVNKYPNLMETISEKMLSDSPEMKSGKILYRQRAGMAIEYLRHNTEQFVNKKGFRPRVAIASFGQLTMRKARAAFAYDFMGVSGFDIENEKSYNSYSEAVKDTAALEVNIVVVCSSDPDYQEYALDFVKEFRATNSSTILLLAGNPEDIKDELKEAGLDGFIHVRSDIFATLTEIQQNILRTIKHQEI